MITLQPAAVARELRMPWRNAIAVGRGYELLRPDLVEHLRFVQRAIGYRYCRFHGIFHDDVNVVTRRGDGTLAYQWHQVDKIYDTLLALGLRPFVELNSMPQALASGDQRLFTWRMNVTPPRSYVEWGALVEAFARHLIERYGLAEVRQWYFEVWNEPNLSGFWSGTQQEYWQLYAAAARALKQVDQGLRVGGPATAFAGWVPELIAHCETERVPLDFVSTHSYSQDEYFLYKDRVGSPYPLGEYLVSKVREVQQQVRQSARPDLEIHWTEWNTISAGSTAGMDWVNNPTLDSVFAAPFIVRACLATDDACDTLCYWTASDIFEENGFAHCAFSGTYGIVNIHGIPKASFHAFALLKRMRGQLLDARLLTPAPTGCGVCAVQDRDVVRILLWNHHLLEQPTQPVWEETLRLPGTGAGAERLVIGTRIRAGAGSAFETWVALGRPQNLSAAEEDLLRAHAQPAQELQRLAGNELAVTLAPNEVLLLEVRPVSPAAVGRGAPPVPAEALVITAPTA